MGNTADLATVQKTIVDTLHKEGKSQRVITERGGAVQGVLYQSILNASWLEGRNWIGKCAQATEMTASLRILSSKADSNTWESFTRSELKLESVYQESPRSDIFRKRATSHFWTRDIVRSILPGLRRKKTGLLLSGPKSSFQMKVNVTFHLEIKVPESGGREERHRIQVTLEKYYFILNK